MSLAKEFKEFAMKGNVIDMAVGVIIGAAFGKIVASLVEDVIMPPLGKVIGDVNFSDLAISLGMGADGKTEVLWKYGNFLQIVFQFLIVAMVLFMVIRGMNKLKKPDPAAPAPTAAAPGSAARGNPRPAREEIVSLSNQHDGRRSLHLDVPDSGRRVPVLRRRVVVEVRVHRFPRRATALWSGRRVSSHCSSGLFLFRRARVAIGASAIAAALVGISAAVFAPSAKGPAILFLAALAIVCASYAALAARVLFDAHFVILLQAPARRSAAATALNAGRVRFSCVPARATTLSSMRTPPNFLSCSTRFHSIILPIGFGLRLIQQLVDEVEPGLHGHHAAVFELPRQPQERMVVRPLDLLAFRRALQPAHVVHLQA